LVLGLIKVKKKIRPKKYVSDAVKHPKFIVNYFIKIKVEWKTTVF